MVQNGKDRLKVTIFICSRHACLNSSITIVWTEEGSPWPLWPLDPSDYRHVTVVVLTSITVRCGFQTNLLKWRGNYLSSFLVLSFMCCFHLLQETGGTVERLTQALTDLTRDDCVTLLKNLVDQSSGSEFTF